MGSRGSRRITPSGGPGSARLPDEQRHRRVRPVARPQRMTVDLSAYPDLVVIYLGMRVEEARGMETLQRLAPEIQASVEEQPDGLLLHENLTYSQEPLHVGMRQYLARPGGARKLVAHVAAQGVVVGVPARPRRHLVLARDLKFMRDHRIDRHLQGRAFELHARPCGRRQEEQALRRHSRARDSPFRVRTAEGTTVELDYSSPRPADGHDELALLESLPWFEPGKPLRNYMLHETDFYDEVEQIWGRRWGAEGIGTLREVLVSRPTENEIRPGVRGGVAVLLLERGRQRRPRAAPGAVRRRTTRRSRTTVSG